MSEDRLDPRKRAVLEAFKQALRDDPNDSRWAVMAALKAGREYDEQQRKEDDSMATRKTAEQKKLLATLTELGGAVASQDDVTFEGTKVVVPERWTVKKAITTLQQYQDMMEEPHRFHRSFKYRPWDGAAAMARALKRITGFGVFGKATQSFFGSNPPMLISIDVGVNETIQVPWGDMDIPLFDAFASVGGMRDEEFGLIFSVDIEAPKKHGPAIEGFFNVIQDELEQRSIYKGKVFDGAEQPHFVDVSGIDPRLVVYSDEVMEQLDANVWSMIEHSEVMERNDVPLKRAVLLHGPYGTGKTLAGLLTAQVAERSGWTFIQCRPGIDNVYDAMKTARLYQPAVVFYEDVDTIAQGDQTQGHVAVTQLLDIFDGLTAKSTKILAILTTNHPEKIHKGMVRPGRLDAVLEIGELDRNGMARLIEAKVEPEAREKNLDYDAIFEAAQGYLPAFVAEFIDRAKRYSIARTGADPQKLTTEDFVRAAEGLRPQYDMMQDAEEGKGRSPLDVAFASAVQSAIDGEIVATNDNVSLDLRVNNR